MVTLVEVKPCACGHPFDQHIAEFGCGHTTPVAGDDLSCVCVGYVES